MNMRKKIAATAAAIVVVGGAGVATAWWSTTGSGTGSAATTAGVASKLDFTTTAITAMYPGDVAQPLVVKVTNTDLKETVRVASVSAYITTDKAGCDGDDFKIRIGANGTPAPAPSTLATAVQLSWTAQELAAGGFASTASDTIQFNNKAENQDACKGATVTLNYSAV